MRHSSSHRYSPPRKPSLLPWWFLYVLFVVYGSLVPLDFRPHSLENAWIMFTHMNMLNIGAQGRADWIANGVLYIPIGFLTATLLIGERKNVVLGLGIALFFSYALALAVEFTQLFFPPRTVSQNDLIAEFIGSTAGGLLAIRGAARFKSFFASLTGHPERLSAHLLKAYALAYLAFSLFPYDFIVSASELADKLHSGNWAWWLVHDSYGSLGWAKLLAELIAVIPLGWLLASRGRDSTAATVAFSAGLIVGLTIEVAQFFVVSGVAQGLSVLTRAIGMLVGAELWKHRASLHFSALSAVLRRHLWLISLGYLVSLAAVNGWFEQHWGEWEVASYTLSQVRFLPFYYHYYTTEQAALLSLSAVMLMYAPIGFLTWASWFSATWALFLGATAAAVIETSKLFLQNQHPDPTNLLLAALSAWLSAKLLQRLAHANLQTEAKRHPSASRKNHKHRPL